MKSLADGLPVDIARQVDPEWRKNELEYWDVREDLLREYRGRWIAFSRGEVVASGTRPVVVFQAAHETDQHPFITCVGHEDKPYRLRRTTFDYDTASSYGSTWTEKNTRVNCTRTFQARNGCWVEMC